ncbi:hypothetical protein [Rhodococcus sp. NPDC060176]|uniref:hypothetical protein n=1 Tax=Rhodococcus sp. NPDC060176 TaxID=3347062 RepID=UPI003652396C
MTGVDVEHTKALEAAATPGPWSWDQMRSIVSDADFTIVVDSFNDGVGAGVIESADAEFIAHARTALPALVAAVERVQALHTKSNQGYGEDDYCDCCGTIWPCLTIEALETP